MLEYHGSVLETVTALISVLHGGQICIDSNTFHGINSRLPDLADAVPESPNYELFGRRGSSRQTKRGTVIQ